MATDNSISTGWLILYVLLALAVLYGSLAFVGAL
ncbi:hypothetical protein HALDL1_15595 [Halobacterium sp. DL1]|jgi:hypothetical protein|nr:hypothetical protein HALDL1_15595 [Halobacterium sp. DL1]